jgi:hypothetical protein
MRTTLLRLALVTVLSAGSLLGAAAPAQAASPQIDGTAEFQVSEGAPCAEAPEPYTDYPALVMDGDLEGCWYTDVLDFRMLPNGVYTEVGEELFVGRQGDGAMGTFTTTYRFEARFEEDLVTEIRGRCQHPVVAGSGTGGFAGATGRLDFKDIIGDPITYVYRGHIRLP